MSNFILFHTINLINFTVNIYMINNKVLSSISTDAIDALTDILNTKEYPREIVETLESFSEISKIEVLDYEGNMLLNSEILV